MMRFFLFVIFLRYTPVECGKAEGRIEENILLEYFFDQKTCGDEGFSATGGTIDAGSLVSMVNTTLTFDCPSFEVDGNKYSHASNGFTANEQSGIIGLKAVNEVDELKDIFFHRNRSATIEIWVYIEGALDVYDTSLEANVLFEFCIESDENISSWVYHDCALRLMISNDTENDLDCVVIHNGLDHSKVCSQFLNLDVGMHHIAFSIEVIDEETTIRNIFVDNVLIATSTGPTSFQPDKNYSTLYIGGSAVQLLEDPDRFKPLPGSVHLFSIYDGVQNLTQNYLAGHGTSSAVLSVDLFLDETDFYAFDLSDYVFDFDTFTEGDELSSLEVNCEYFADALCRFEDECDDFISTDAPASSATNLANILPPIALAAFTTLQS